VGAESIAWIPEDQPQPEIRPCSLVADVRMRVDRATPVTTRSGPSEADPVQDGDDADTPGPGREVRGRATEVRRLISVIRRPNVRDRSRSTVLSTIRNWGRLRRSRPRRTRRHAADGEISPESARWGDRQYRLFDPAQNVWEFDSLSQFVKDIQSVDPEAHGTSVTTFAFLRQMKEGYEQTALYALLGVAAISLITFRAVRPALLALVPLAVETA
jgi:hypothetical protein